MVVEVLSRPEHDPAIDDHEDEAAVALRVPADVEGTADGGGSVKGGNGAEDNGTSAESLGVDVSWEWARESTRWVKSGG